MGGAGLVDNGTGWGACCSLCCVEGGGILGFSLSLAGTTGVDGVVGVAADVSCVTLKSLSLSGFGAGEIGREGGLLARATGMGAGLGTAGVSLPRFSKRARIDETGLCGQSQSRVSLDRITPTYQRRVVRAIVVSRLDGRGRRHVEVVWRGTRAELPIIPMPIPACSWKHAGARQQRLN